MNRTVVPMMRPPAGAVGPNDEPAIARYKRERQEARARAKELEQEIGLLRAANLSDWRTISILFRAVGLYQERLQRGLEDNTLRLLHGGSLLQFSDWHAGLSEFVESGGVVNLDDNAEQG